MAQSNTRRAPNRLLEGTRLRLTSLLHPDPQGRLPDPSYPLAPAQGPTPKVQVAAGVPSAGPKRPGKPLGMARPTVVLLPAPPTIQRPMSRPVFLPEPQPLPAGYTPAVKPADFLRWMAQRERPDWRQRFHPMKILALGFCLSSMILGFAGGAKLSAAGKNVLRPAVAHAAVTESAAIAPTFASATSAHLDSPAPPPPKRGVIIEQLAPKYTEAAVHVQITEAVVLTPVKKLKRQPRGKRVKARAARRPRR